VTGSGETASMGGQGKPVSKGASNNCQSKEKDEAWVWDMRHTVNTVGKEALSLCECLGALDGWEKYNFRVEQLLDARIGGHKSSKSRCG